ncbi:hypothetical protein CASFOL_006816 [Castilleja foliolosa]|uniref:F-box domain-containing protein n=1 Tax=Castilleja foliolosa TaxID=1961234 RepID=A0ABD3E7F7_9LAMI
MAKLRNFNDGDEGEKPSSSAQIVASIDDLLIEIIKRLPLKKIAQLKVVSKYWNSIILDPKLCLLQNQLPLVCLMFERLEEPNSDHPQSYIIFIDKSMSPPARKMIRTIDAWPCQVLHSCNGLRTFVCKRSSHQHFPEILCLMTICGMYLAFDPSNSPHYKVVCVLRSLGGLLHLFEVYSSETGSCGELFQAFTHFDFEDGVYWNGAIHWVNIVTGPWEFVYLNLDCDQTLKVFPQPPLQEKRYYKNDYHFGESCGHLHFVDVYRTVCEFIVYEMKMDYSEWFVKYKVKGTCFPHHREYDIVRYKFEQKTGETLYDVVDFEPIAIDHSVIWDSVLPFQYIESICSV